MNQKINIVFATDNNYVQHLAATITSIFMNTNHSSNMVINIIDGGISEENKIYLNNLVSKFNSEICYKNIDPSLLGKVVINGHITEATYYRILIPSLFHDDVKKVLYLDCDIIVRDDISKLWNIDIKNYALGAVKLYEFRDHNRLQIPPDASYFNAGILILNLKKWRDFNLSRKVIEYINAYPERLISWDQDALNGVLYDDWLELPLKWNLRSQLFSMNYLQAGCQSVENFNKLKENPSIVHFTTASKPWHLLNDHPYKNEYFYYLDKSGYKYKKFPEEKVLSSKKIVFFGASKKAIELTRRLNQFKFDVSFYVDNDPKKWGKELEGKKINNPNILLERTSDIVVIIASQYVNEISEQLSKLNLVKNKDYFEDLSSLYLLGNL